VCRWFRICEVFANLGKAGGCPSQSEATCRAVSAALRSGVDPAVMIDQLSGIRCLSAAVARKANKEVDVLSCPDAIARAIKEAMGVFDPEPASWFRRTCEICGGRCGGKRTALCATSVARASADESTWSHLWDRMIWSRLSERK